MSRKLVLLLAIALWSVMTLPLPKQAGAETVLTHAVLESLRNIVRLIPQNRNPRLAHLSDSMTPGDALSTGQSSLAELRFNDGSLARVGEQALFRFTANTRNLNLNNGTVLLLIPPGHGRTNLRTPNAAAAIRGSALFVRYSPETDTTIVGALTNSNIEVSNQSGRQSQVLRAGQLAVVVQNQIEHVYDFDLKTFYQTSDLVRGLDLTKQSGVLPDPAIAPVQAETAMAAAAQSPITGSEVTENPDFVKLHASSSPSAGADVSRPLGPFEQSLDTRQILYDILTSRQNNPPLAGTVNPVPTPALPVTTPVPIAGTTPVTGGIPVLPTVPSSPIGVPTVPNPTLPPPGNRTPPTPTIPGTPPTPTTPGPTTGPLGNR